MLDAVIDFLPAPTDIPSIKGTDEDGNEVERHASDDEPFSALAFKIMADPFVGKLTFFRVYSGTCQSGSYVLNSTKDKKERLGRILQMHANKRNEIDEVYAGDIAAAVGFKNTTTGDTICDEKNFVILEKLVFICKKMSDEEKIRIKNEIRYEIFRHRYFEDADWSMPQEVLREYECVMNKIVVGEKIYDYLYIFSHVYDFPLLNPIPYSKEENTEIHNQNYILREEEINARIKKFKEKGYSIDILIQLAVKEKYDVVGEVLAQFYCDGLFDEKVFFLHSQLN